MRVSTQLEHITSLSVEELLRVTNAIDCEIARCKVVAKSAASLQYRHIVGKINKLQQAKALFLSEITDRQQSLC